MPSRTKRDGREELQGESFFLTLVLKYHDVEVQPRSGQSISDPSRESHLPRLSVQPETPVVIS